MRRPSQAVNSAASFGMAARLPWLLLVSMAGLFFVLSAALPQTVQWGDGRTLYPATATIHRGAAPNNYMDRWRASFDREKQSERRLQEAASKISSATGRHASYFKMPVASGFQLADTGSYFARLTVGSGRPRDLYMIIDTGSDLSWIQCQPCQSCFQQLDQPIFNPAASSTNRNVTCDSPLCADVPPFTSCLPISGHSRNALQSCAFQITYYDSSTTSGTLITDTLTLGSGHSFPNMAFGCSTASNGTSFVAAAGVLGLGTGTLSLPSQLHKSGRPSTFSYCLPHMFSSFNSTLTFGAPFTPDTIFTPLVRNPNPALQTHYYITLEGISVGRFRLPLPTSLFQINPRTGEGGTMVDSGTTITTLPPLAYNALRDALRKSISANVAHLGPADPFEPIFDTCYLPNGRSHDEQGHLYAGVPWIVLHFARGADLHLPPANVIAPIERVGGEDKRVCLNMAPSRIDRTVIGNIQQQGIRFTFDIQNSRLGFSTSPNHC